ncbi:37873_t:CDS:1, partial [Gigaspora margarita]
LQQYYRLKTYLETAEMPFNLSQPQQKQFRRQAAHYCLQNGLVYRRNKKGKTLLLRVIKENKLEQILYSLHLDIIAGHFGVESTYNKARSKYFWPQMY